ncbi:MAG: anthranilate phosphoribosyltransferase [Myxococcales bacterium]|nr:anthranilate phosphoribosyltransferase [Myxococcales bacterium]
MTLQTLIRGEPLSLEAATSFMRAMMDGELSEPQMAAALAVLEIRNPTPQELSGFIEALTNRMILIPDVPDGTIDTCGTGGSGGATLNTSTMAGIVAAASGATVAKHGNRSASGRCGSLDVLEALGAQVQVGPKDISELLKKHRFAFVNARQHHPGLGRLGPLRSQLGFRTVFNILGPMVSPARVRRQLVGVSHPRLAPIIAETLSLLNHERSWVVCGPDNHDEIALHGPTHVWAIEPSGVSEFQLDPRDAGLPMSQTVSEPALRGGDTSYNAHRFESILRGEDSSPAQDYVALNAGAALFIAGLAEDLKDGVAQALTTIKSGEAFQTFVAWRDDTVARTKGPL